MNHKKILSLLLAAAMILSLCACSSSAGSTAASTEPATTKATASSSAAASTAAVQEKEPLLAVQTGDQKAAAVYSDNFSFTQGALTYFFAVTFNNYYNYLSYFGVDTTKSLKDQYYIEGTSWFDFFMEEAVAYAEQYLIFAEYAKEKGLTLTDAQKTYVDKQLADVATEASYYGWDANTFLEQLFHTNINTDILREALNVMILSDAGYEALVNEIQIDPAEVEREFLTNPKQYTQVDYVYINFLEGSDLTDADKAELEKAFAAAKDEASFQTAIELYAKKTADVAAIDKAGGLSVYAKQIIADHTKANTAYADSAFLNWAFAEERKAGDVYLDPEITSGGAHYAYMLLKPAYRNLARLVDVRHILFKTDTYGTADKAKAEAQKIMDEWLKAGGTEEKFADFCAQYSEDGNASSGGLYEGVTEGYMVKTFNDWIFDSSRKYGDYGIVETEYGAHIMFFVKSGESWYRSAENAVYGVKMDEVATDILTRHGITSNNDVLATIVW